MPKPKRIGRTSGLEDIKIITEAFNRFKDGMNRVSETLGKFSPNEIDLDELNDHTLSEAIGANLALLTARDIERAKEKMRSMKPPKRIFCDLCVPPGWPVIQIGNVHMCWPCYDRKRKRDGEDRNHER